MCKVLVADSNRKYLAKLGSYLRAKGHDPILASTPEECLQAAARQPVQAILLDLDFPGRNSGLELLAKLRGRGVKAMAVILGNDPATDNFEGWELLDVFDVLKHDVDQEKLVSRVEWAADLTEHMDEAMELMDNLHKNTQEATAVV